MNHEIISFSRFLAYENNSDKKILHIHNFMHPGVGQIFLFAIL